MKFHRSICAALVLLAALFVATASAGTFDGAWSVTLNTPENKDPTGVVSLGYTFQFPAEVRNGVLHGERGTKDQPGWLEIDGPIAANGAAMLHVNGIISRPEYALANATTGHPYHYDVKAHFSATKGSGSRIGGRIGNFTFVRQ